MKINATRTIIFISYLLLITPTLVSASLNSKNIMHHIQSDVIAATSTPSLILTVKAYRSLAESIDLCPSLVESPDALGLLLSPLAFNAFEHTIVYNKYIAQAKKNYAMQLLKLIPSLQLCPSEALLLTANNAMIKGLKKLSLKNRALFADAFSRMIIKEREIYHNGNIALYHGTPRYNYALSYLHTKLHELFYGPTPDYLHLRQPLYTECLTPSNETTRMNYLENGGMWTRFHNAQQLLFCNAALTGNLYQHALFNEDSLTFFAKEKTVFNGWKRFVNYLRRLFFGQKTKISARILFDRYNLHDVYRKYRHRIKKLLYFHAHGNVMLQIELSPTLAQQTLFPAEPIGKRTSLLVNNQKTTDSMTILNALCANPYAVVGANKTVWCVVLTKDLLLDPYHPDVFGHLKVHAYSMEQEKLEKMKRHVDRLIEDIKKDMSIQENSPECS